MHQAAKLHISCSEQPKPSSRLTVIPTSPLRFLPASRALAHPHTCEGRSALCLVLLPMRKRWNSPFFEHGVSCEKENKFNCCLGKNVNWWSNNPFPFLTVYTPIMAMETNEFTFTSQPAHQVYTWWRELPLNLRSLIKKVKIPVHSAGYLCCVSSVSKTERRKQQRAGSRGEEWRHLSRFSNIIIWLFFPGLISWCKTFFHSKGAGTHQI